MGSLTFTTVPLLFFNDLYPAGNRYKILLQWSHARNLDWYSFVFRVYQTHGSYYHRSHCPRYGKCHYVHGFALTGNRTWLHENRCSLTATRKTRPFAAQTHNRYCGWLAWPASCGRRSRKRKIVSLASSTTRPLTLFRCTSCPARMETFRDRISTPALPFRYTCLPEVIRSESLIALLMRFTCASLTLRFGIPLGIVNPLKSVEKTVFPVVGLTTRISLTRLTRVARGPTRSSAPAFSTTSLFSPTMFIASPLNELMCGLCATIDCRSVRCRNHTSCSCGRNSRPLSPAGPTRSTPNSSSVTQRLAAARSRIASTSPYTSTAARPSIGRPMLAKSRGEALLMDARGPSQRGLGVISHEGAFIGH